MCEKLALIDVDVEVDHANVKLEVCVPVAPEGGKIVVRAFHVNVASGLGTAKVIELRVKMFAVVLVHLILEAIGATPLQVSLEIAVGIVVAWVFVTIPVAEFGVAVEVAPTVVQRTVLVGVVSLVFEVIATVGSVTLMIDVAATWGFVVVLVLVFEVTGMAVSVTEVTGFVSVLVIVVELVTLVLELVCLFVWATYLDL